MKLIALFGAALMAAAMAAPLTAQASTSVDTGTPSGSPGWNFHQEQYFAAEFTLLESTTLTAVYGDFDNRAGGPGTVALEILADGGNIPGASLFSTTNSVNALAGLDWRGASGLSWTLSAGTYWAGFTPDGNIEGVMPGTAPSPLAEYAQGSVSAGWHDGGPDQKDFRAIGLRIEGDASDVPLPAAPPMLLASLSGIGLIARRRKAA